MLGLVNEPCDVATPSVLVNVRGAEQQEAHTVQLIGLSTKRGGAIDIEHTEAYAKECHLCNVAAGCEDSTV